VYFCGYLKIHCYVWLIVKVEFNNKIRAQVLPFRSAAF